MANFGVLRNYLTKVHPIINSSKSLINVSHFHSIETNKMDK